MPAAADAIARAESLIGLFATPADFGSLRVVEPGEVPEPQRSLLHHHSHMTVAMERFHGGPVSLRVVASRLPQGSATGYAREILLLDGGGRTVQHGIVRIDLGLVPARAAERIRAAAAPLGRVLIEAGSLCDVQQVQLLAVAPGPHLAGLIGPRPTYGRVATIAVAGLAAVELLEIVADVPAVSP